VALVRGHTRWRWRSVDQMAIVYNSSATRAREMPVNAARRRANTRARGARERGARELGARELGAVFDDVGQQAHPDPERTLVEVERRLVQVLLSTPPAPHPQPRHRAWHLFEVPGEVLPA